MDKQYVNFSENNVETMVKSFQLDCDMENVIKGRCAENPDLLYHYTTPDGLMGITGGDALTFRFSQYDFLNDFSEGLNIFEHYYAVLDEMQKQGDISEDFYRVAIALNKENTLQQSLYSYDSIEDSSIVDSFPCRSFVCCFSKAEDALPLWNGYASNGGYSGYSLGLPYVELESFNTKKIRELLQKSMKQQKEDHNDSEKQFFLDCYSGSVIYDDAKKRELLKKHIKKIADNESANTRNQLLKMLCFYRPFFKNKASAHEKEYRLLLLIADKEPEILASTKLIKTRARGMYLIPYIEVSFEKEWLKQIRMSPTANYKDVEISLKDYLRRNGYEDVEICESSCPARY